MKRQVQNLAYLGAIRVVERLQMDKGLEHTELVCTSASAGDQGRPCRIRTGLLQSIGQQFRSALEAFPAPCRHWTSFP
jgi:hypothetical protein